MRQPLCAPCGLPAAGPIGLALLLAVAAPAPAIGAEPTTVLVILDGSGSMWSPASDDKRSKLLLVRDGVKRGLGRIARESRVGLIAFGHRRTSDCGDIETVVKPGEGTGPAVGAALDKVGARGRGPITQALREAARQLPGAPAPAAIVLVHDDLDNCQLDPCSAVGDLRRANPRVVVHVVSLQMKKDDAQRMTCLPKVTGGRHFEAQGATQIMAAVEEAVRLGGIAPAEARPAAKAEPPPAPPTVPPAAAAQPALPGLTLRAALVDGGPPLDARLRWRVLRRGETVPVWEGDEMAPRLALPSGRYEVEAWLGFVRARQSVDVTEGAAQALVVGLGAGLLQMPQGPAEAAERRRALADVVVTLKRIDASAETVAFQRGIAGDIALVPGNYVVSVTAGAMRLERTLGIRAGQVTAFDAALGLGIAEITTVAVADGPAVGGAMVTVLEDDPDAPQGRREIWRSAAIPATALLPAGGYYVVARRGTVEARERITIKAGDIERRTIVLDLARLAVQARIAGGRIEATEPVSHRLERLDGDREAVISSEPQATFHVSAGRWRLESRIGLANAIVQREIDLKAGAREQLMLDLPAGVVRLRWLDGAGGNPLPDVAWEVREAAGRRIVWSSSQTEGRPVLLAGRYTVRAEVRDRRVERSFEVRAGEVRIVDIVGQ